MTDKRYLERMGASPQGIEAALEELARELKQEAMLNVYEMGRWFERHKLPGRVPAWQGTIGDFLSDIRTEYH